MNPNDLINVFVKYGYIVDSNDARQEALDLFDEDNGAEVFVHELLAEYAYEQGIRISQGDCVDEDVIEDFLSNFEKVIEASKGRVKLEKLTSIPNIGTNIGLENITILFTWSGKDYSFTFSQPEPNDFIYGFSKWVFEAVNGDFIFFDYDTSFGYFLPKELIKELKILGFEGSAIK
jgi:hypothetical protein